MSVTASRKLQNDIVSLTESSDKLIDPNNHYVIRIEYSNSKVDALIVAKGFIEGLVTGTKPLVVYVFRHTLYLLFSSVDPDSGEKHCLNGSHHAIGSAYASAAALEKKCRCSVSIIEFDSRTKVIVYFQSKIAEAMGIALIENSGGSLTKKNVSQFTLSECVDKLRSAGVEWDQLSTVERYGAFYKYSAKKFSVMSEIINPQNIERYIAYFFE